MLDCRVVHVPNVNLRSRGIWRHDFRGPKSEKGPIDNVFVERLWRSLKYEFVYLREFEGIQELYQGLFEYFEFYNNERLHQALDYAVPASVYTGTNLMIG